jgi:hypothetical protein
MQEDSANFERIGSKLRKLSELIERIITEMEDKVTP